MTDAEARCRELWTAQGVSPERQDELIADITAKAQPEALAAMKAAIFPAPRRTSTGRRIVCHPKCAFAKGQDCDCPCEGRYHGKGAMICEAFNAAEQSEAAKEIARNARPRPLWQPRLF